ncbi:uncharacterized protein B4U79_01361 [Dinothrombium tinctorium]|uniref:CUB domain-containing protein n=1 Tax=Dinothrombium tinctorium TaxID=1965070 RepID=A0A3S3Q9S3_9ACAR|nr:uncharacterized protein B4U79_01361 [Dinothrombium tinctorium]
MCLPILYCFTCILIAICEAKNHNQNPSDASLVPLGMYPNNNGKSPLVAATYYFNPTSQLKKEPLFAENIETNDNDIQEQDICQAADGRKGSCYEATECVNRGGMPMGRCHSSRSIAAVCCLFEITCGESSSEQFVYFRNPNFPRSYDNPRICRVRIGKKSKNICQYKLDLLTLNLAPPNYGNCSQDVFIISGQNENHVIPKICGSNSGQHYYFGVDESGVVSLHMLLLSSYKRRFDIFITQIPCGSETLAPSHCLQYYTGTYGVIKSFNYDSPFLESDSSTGYPNDIDYIMCIKKESGFCSISYDLSSNGDGISPFAVGSSSETEKSLWRPIVAQCRDDYLTIGGIRLCSGKLNGHPYEEQLESLSRQDTTILNATLAYPTVITDTTPGPFVIRFVSNNANNARGFNLTYRQNPCK